MSETTTRAARSGPDVIDAEARPANGQALAPQGGPLLSLAAALQGRPKLAAALVAAIRACKAVPHDATGQFGGSKDKAYTSSEAIFEEARKALADNDLAVIPLRATVNGSEREGPDRFELVQERLLLHSSGEALVCSSAWPIVPGAGRPLDKATAAADTLSLSYFLRDLLQLPRVDPADEVNQRDDSGRQPAAQDPAAKKPPPTPRTGPQLLARLRKRDAFLASQGRCDAGALLAHMAAFAKEHGYNPDIAGWGADVVARGVEAARAFEAALGKPAAPQAPECISVQQEAELVPLLRESGADVAALLREYAIPALAKLPALHLADLRGRLLAEIARKRAPEQPAAAPAEESYPKLLLRIDRLLKAADPPRTWTGAVGFVSYAMGGNWAAPGGWQEPRTEAEVVALAQWLPREAAVRIEQSLSGKK